jgi:ketosteroid isomerase-like protein
MMKSQMLLLLLTTSFLLGATARAAEPAKDVEKALRALNDAFKNSDLAAIGRLMTDNHVAVTPYYGGPLSKAEQLKVQPDFKLTEYGMGDVKITFLSKDVALVSYPLTLKGTFKGKAVPTKNFASAIWVQQDGKWREAYYQETALDGK